MQIQSTVIQIVGDSQEIQFGGRTGKHKLGVKAGKYKLGAGGQAEGRGPRNTKTRNLRVFFTEMS